MKQTLRYFTVMSMLVVCAMASAQSTVKVMEITNGTVTADKTSASKGETVMLTVTPADGFYFEKEDLEVVRTVNPGVANSRRKIPINDFIEVTGSDPSNLSKERTYTFTVPDDGYELQVSATFEARIPITYDMVTLSATEYTYNGKEQKPTVSVEGLTIDTDYTLVFDETTSKNYGSYTVSVNGISKFIGEVNNVFFIDPASLTIKAGNYTKVEGEENPEFTLTFEGFVNNETREVLTYQPEVTCFADKDSSAGDYPVMLCCAAADNYNIFYEDGMLTITEKPKMVGDVNEDGLVDIADVVAVANAILTGDDNQTYDINNDGFVNAKDIVDLVDIIANVE